MNNKTPTFTANSNLEKRARFYTNVIAILFANQGLSGGKVKQAARGARHLSLGIKLNNPNELERTLNLSENIALASNCENVLAQRQAGLIYYQFQLAQGFWQSYTRQDLPSNEAIGLAEKKQPVNFDFRQPHALVAGSTNSGKSETIKSILLSLMTTHTPTELGIILIDLHGDYGDFENEAHLVRFDFGSIATDQKHITQALGYVNQELAYRKANSIKNGKLLVLVIDEADKVLQDEERKEIVRAISQEGRKFNLHVVLGTQKPSHKDLPNILDNLLNRFVGLVSDAKVSANLTGRSGLQAHLLTGSGDFIHVCGMEIQRFQVALSTSRDFNGLERMEIQPVAVEDKEVIELPAELPGRPVGRPQLQLNPEWLAAYFYYHPDKISRSIARELLGLSRDNHELHKRFCEEFIKAYLELRQANTPKIGA